MNDFAISTQILNRSGLQGLPQRLVNDGLVDEFAMVEAIAAAKERRVSIVSYLVEHNLADAREIAIAASHEFGAPLLDLSSIQPDLDTVRVVSDKLLRKHRLLPLVKRGKKLFVAISDPTNLHALDEVKFATGFSIEAVVVEEDKLAQLLTKTLEQVDTAMPELAGDDSFEMDSLDVVHGEDGNAEDPERSDAVDDAPIVRFINKVMLDAIKRGASDIHFEPYERSYRIRFRLDGVLKEVAAPPVQLAIKMAARLKVMSRLDIAERRVPQDGRIKMKISKNRAIDFRVSTCPTLFGEKIVMRILDPSSAMLGIDSLGYEPFQKKLYMDALARPHGMILVTGPTGSGKTVSLYTGLNILNTEDTNISTAEDPVEIMLPGINQVNVNPKVGSDISRCAARVSPPGSGRDHGRRNPRHRNGRDRPQSGPDRPPGAFDPAHERRSQDLDPPRRHGCQAVRDRDVGKPDHRPASGQAALHTLQGAHENPGRGPAEGRLYGRGNRERPPDFHRRRLPAVHGRV